MRQPYKEKFLSDVDGDGYPIPNHLPFAVLNIGKLPDVKVAQALLADTRCLNCPPVLIPNRPLTIEEQAFVDEHEELHRQYQTSHPKTNPPGWTEIDGTKLPLITWADENPHTHAVLLPVKALGITILSDAEAHEAFFGWKK